MNTDALLTAIDQQNRFAPPYCPNPECQYHKEGKDFFHKNGWCKTEKMPGINRKFICKSCGRQFSYNTFSLDYRCRIINLFEKINFDVLNSMGHSSIARKLCISETTVRNRIAELARQALLVDKLYTEKTTISEPIAYDGFESFSYSQYSPCYINTAVGKNSLFIYKTTFSPLNRKGRMTEMQKQKNQSLIEKFGKYPTRSIREETTRILEELCRKSMGEPLELHTDEHKSYKYAIAVDLKKYPIEHHTTHSKAPRTTLNDLFPVNHLHRNYRHFLASHRRETIAFQQNEAATMDKVTLHRLYRNFMSPRMYRYARDRRIPKITPAMVVGLVGKILAFNELYPYRRLETQFELDDREYNQFHRIWEFSRRKIREY